MFTLGFRLFGLFSLVGLVGTVTYGIATGDTGGKDYLGVINVEAIKGVVSFGWQGGVGEHLGYIILLFLTLVSLALGIVLVVYRDANALAMAQLESQDTAPQPQTTPSRNFWPLIVVFGVAMVIVGLVTTATIVVMGLILAAVGIFEWVIFAWSERLTADPATNRKIRNQVMAPIEIPVLGIAIISILSIGASRIFLAVSELNAVWIGTGIAAIIFLGAIFFATKPKISQGLITSLLVLLALGVIVAGIVSAAVGSRNLHSPEKVITQNIESGQAETSQTGHNKGSDGQ